jgi:hypothetical protein
VQPDDLLAQILREIVEKHDQSKGTLSLQMIYSKLKDVFEVKYTETGTDLPTATPDVAKEHAILVNESHEERPLASGVPQSTLVASTTFDGTCTGSARNIGSGLEDVSASIKRQRLSQYLYISTERNAKERKLEGKNPFLVEVSRDGEPIGKNVARWASELGVRCRAHLDICKSSFAEKDP